jgi:hypothetical protein
VTDRRQRYVRRQTLSRSADGDKVADCNHSSGPRSGAMLIGWSRCIAFWGGPAIEFILPDERPRGRAMASLPRSPSGGWELMMPLVWRRHSDKECRSEPDSSAA